jgi:hypothetical protein
MMKLVLVALLGGVAWVAWDSREDLQRYLRIRAM